MTKPWLCTAAFEVVLGAFAGLARGRMDAHVGPMGGKSPLCSAQSARESPMGQFPFIAQLDISPSSCCFPNLYYYALMLQERGVSG